MTHLDLFDRQIFLIEFIGMDHDRHALRDGQAIALKTCTLGRIIGNQADAGKPQI